MFVGWEEEKEEEQEEHPCCEKGGKFDVPLFVRTRTLVRPLSDSLSTAYFSAMEGEREAECFGNFFRGAAIAAAAAA